MIQIYLYDGLREKNIRQVELLYDTFITKINPIFDDINEKSMKIATDYYEKIMSLPCDEHEIIDPEIITEQADSIGYKHYSDMSFMKYYNLISWIAMLYEFSFQQLKSFLLEALRFTIFNNVHLERLEHIEDTFKQCGVNVSGFVSWRKINELRLVCNVIKHGDGSSARKLLKLNKDIFFIEGMEDINLLQLYSVSMTREVLNVNENTFKVYCDNLILFWNELPKRMWLQI